MSSRLFIFKEKCILSGLIKIIIQEGNNLFNQIFPDKNILVVT